MVELTDLFTACARTPACSPGQTTSTRPALPPLTSSNTAEIDAEVVRSFYATPHYNFEEETLRLLRLRREAIMKRDVSL